MERALKSNTGEAPTTSCGTSPEPNIIFSVQPPKIIFSAAGGRVDHHHQDRYAPSVEAPGRGGAGSLAGAKSVGGRDEQRVFNLLVRASW